MIFITATGTKLKFASKSRGGQRFCLTNDELTIYGARIVVKMMCHKYPLVIHPSIDADSIHTGKDT